MTRRERQQMKRKNQIRRALKRYRTKQREKKASVAPAPVVERDPIWADPPHAAITAVPQPPAHEPLAPPEPEEQPKPPKEMPYIRRAARLKQPKPPVPLGDAVDPETGRRRVRIVMSDGRVIEGETRGGGGDGIPSATEILDWEN